jgi:CHAT domain-containing protein
MLRPSHRAALARALLPLVLLSAAARAEDPADRSRESRPEAVVAEATERLRGPATDPVAACAAVEALDAAQRALGDPFGARATLEDAAALEGAGGVAARLALARLDLADGEPARALARVDAVPREGASGIRADLLSARALRAQERAADGVARLGAAAQALASLPQADGALALDAARTATLFGGAAADAAGSIFAAARAASAAPVDDDAAALIAAALLYRLGGQDADALSAARRAALAANAAGDAPLEHDALAEAGELLAAAGQNAAAMAAFEAAITAGARAPAALLGEAVLAPGGVRERLGRAYLGLAALQLEAAHAATDAALAADWRWRAVATLERFKGTELQEFFLDPCAAEAAVADPRTLAARLPQGLRVFYPAVLADRVEVLLFDRDGISAFEAGERETLARAVRAFRTASQDRAIADWRTPGSEVAARLLAPAGDALAGTTTLLVVADGFLRLLPWAALPYGEGVLVDAMAVAGAPLLAPAQAPRSEGAVVLAGLTEGRQGFASLPGVGRELDTLGGMLEGAKRTTLRDDAFRAETFSAAVSSAAPRIVHLATHGEIGRRASDSFLLTWDGRIALDDLDRLVREDAGAGLDLLALSACQTASGDDRAALGLGGVALRAGARQVLATLWYVSDAATATLAPAFYRGLASADAPQALRAAQRALAADPAFAHPAYWAPYVVVTRVP